MKCDFSGWATKNNLKCGDGTIIRHGAFSDNDGKIVPLVWNHQHNSPTQVLGRARLKNMPNGVYAYCSFNSTPAAKNAKECVKHGDITNLSILANNLIMDGPNITHGNIREVSLVIAGANPGAFVESVLMHGEPIGDEDEEGILYTNDGIVLQHADISTDDGDESDDVDDENEEEEEEDEDDMNGKTVKEVIDGMTDEQKQAMAIVVGQALEDAGVGDEEEEEEEEEDSEVRHSIFNDEERDDDVYISHSDIVGIFEAAKRTGSLRRAFNEYMDENDITIAHSIDTTGMTTATGTQTYGFRDPEMLFPEYKAINGGAPEWISRNTEWVQKVMAAIHHTPFSRVKSVFADITEDEARAKGYLKGNMKKEEFFTILKRVTDPQTVYKKQKMDRDDIVDIGENFDVVVWIRGEMRLMLNEEVARAILIGDGRPTDAEDKIKEDRIRPIVKEPPLFNTKVTVTAGDSDGVTAKNTIDACIRARKHYKGSGTPTFFTTEDVVTEMLLLEDKNGHKLYKTEAELATALRVKEIVTVEVMEGQKVDNADLIGLIVNLIDYNVGTNKGGEINMFDDFDIDYNQQKYLIETRISGALIKPFSAITLVKSGASGAAYSSRNRS